MTRSPRTLTMGWCPAGVRSMIASRRLPRPTPSSNQMPSSSGPRWAMRAFIRPISSAVTGLPLSDRMPAMPHISEAREALREHVDHVVLLLVRHLRIQRQGQRQPFREVRVRKVARRQAVLPLIVVLEAGGVGALAGRYATLLEPPHQLVAPVEQPFDIVEARLLRPKEAYVGLVAMDHPVRGGGRRNPRQLPKGIVISRC